MTTQSVFTLPQKIIEAVAHGYYDDVFAVLGLHALDNQKGYELRCFYPAAVSVDVKSKINGEILARSTRCHDEGVFIAHLKETEPYYFTVDYGNNSFDVEDIYRFSSTISADDLYLFAEGTHERAYGFLGAHLMQLDGIPGCRFSVWAPNALTVSVVGDFNHWNGKVHVMRKHLPSGVWEIFIPYVGEFSSYKFQIIDRHKNILPHKSDPFGFYAQRPPEQASVVANLDAFNWTDDGWQNADENISNRDKPVSIYEVHLGSWKRKYESEYLTYRELADDLIRYTTELGFTHLQLMPVSEFPFDGSWGYQPIGLFAPTSRFGEPCDFKYFVNKCHENNLAVLIDWVPGHFPTDAHGLGQFDGTPLYEHADHRQGFHPDWNTFIYNYGRHEVKSFLLSNAMFWFDHYHIDGLRVDAVASMLYLDYSRKAGEWLPNEHGGRENLAAIDLLRLVNSRVYKQYPNAVMIAEESTAWPGVSSPVDFGGLGFGYKWNMGWMNDSLKYIEKDPIYRKYHHHDMTFSLHYAFSENFVLPLSHDEVVHGKHSLINKMPGDIWQKFANLRAYYGFMWMHPGKKLLFMGCEFAQKIEWNHDQSLCWHELESGFNSGVKTLIGELNHVYKTQPALHRNDCEADGFEWIEADDHHNSVFVFTRKAQGAPDVIVICNFTPSVQENYRIGVNAPGCYKEILNTDSEFFGGTNIGNVGEVVTFEEKWSRFDHSINLRIPALSTLVLVRESH